MYLHTAPSNCNAVEKGVNPRGAKYTSGTVVKIVTNDGNDVKVSLKEEASSLKSALEAVGAEVEIK